MSKGPGRVERIIVATVEAHPSACFTLPDLARLIYPATEHRPIEKKHRSAILRAAKAVLPALGWGWLKANAPGRPPVFFNTCDFASWGRAYTRRMWPHDPIRAEQIFAEPPAGDWQTGLAVGSTGWQRVEAAKLRHDGKPEEAEAIEQRLEMERQMLLARLGMARHGITLPATPP